MLPYIKFSEVRDDRKNGPEHNSVDSRRGTTQLGPRDHFRSCGLRPGQGRPGPESAASSAQQRRGWTARLFVRIRARRRLQFEFRAGPLYHQRRSHAQHSRTRSRCDPRPRHHQLRRLGRWRARAAHQGQARRWNFGFGFHRPGAHRSRLALQKSGDRSGLHHGARPSLQRRPRLRRHQSRHPARHSRLHGSARRPRRLHRLHRQILFSQG